MCIGFAVAVWLSRIHENHAEVGEQRGIMCVHRVKRQLARGWQMENFCSCCLEFTTKAFVLRLSSTPTRLVMKSQLTPSRYLLRIRPPGIGGRTDQHTS